MRILQVCPRYPPFIGGVEAHVNEISERLVKRGHDVEVISCDPFENLPREEVVNGVRIKRFKSWAPKDAYYFSSELKQYLVKNSQSFDVVHAHSFQAFPALYAAQAKFDNKFVFTPHYVGGGGTFFRNLLYFPYKILSSKIFLKADKIICVSKYELELLKSLFKIDDIKLQFIPNGVRLEEFKELRKEKKNYKLILCVSRIEKYKGVQFTIKALKNLDSNVHLMVVGKGPYKNNLIKLVEKMDLSNRVTFYEPLDRAELLKAYSKADVFVLTSSREAMPITIAEALAAKIPCIVSRIPFLIEWIDDKNCFGIDYPIDNYSLSNLLDSVIGSEVSSTKIRDWSSVVTDLENVYSSLFQ
jgi:glycosyltransferase involved in cell wall biosynthesis